MCAHPNLQLALNYVLQMNIMLFKRWSFYGCVFLGRWLT